MDLFLITGVVAAWCAVSLLTVALCVIAGRADAQLVEHRRRRTAGDCGERRRITGGHPPARHRA